MFCVKCGTQIPDDVRFCHKCGTAVGDAVPASPSSTPAVANTGNHTLTVIREKQWYAINPPMKLLINNAKEFSVESGETLPIPLPEGRYIIKISSSIRKRVVEISMSKNMTLKLKWNRAWGTIDAKVI